MAGTTPRTPRTPSNGQSGIGVDAYGNPTVDPTANVIALNEAANRRQDDLREDAIRLLDCRVDCLREVVTLRAEHAKDISTIIENHSREMRANEAQRLDSIRQVDVTAVRTEASRALEAIQTLAATSARDAETLRNLVNTTAIATAAGTADTVKQI